MKFAWTAGTVSRIIHILAQDNTATDGSGKTALAFGDVTAYYVRAGGTLTQLTLETIATLGTWASGGDNKLGFKLLHDTNARGGYELDLPNNILAAGATQVTIFMSASGAAFAPIEIQLEPVLAATAIADAILSRNVSNVQAAVKAAGDKHCLATIILGVLESVVSGGTWTIKQTDGSTTQFALTATTDSAANPVTGVAT